MRIFELSKKIGKTNKEVMELLGHMEISFTNHMSVLSDEVVQAFLKEFPEVEEPKTEAKPEPKQEIKKEQSNSIRPLTAEEQALAARVAAASADDEWKTIREDELNDFSLRNDQFELPPEAKEKEAKKEFKFWWTSNNPSSVDARIKAPIPVRWWICNATQTPFLAKHIDPVTGAVQRFDMILLFKPWRYYEAHQKAKNERGSLQDKQGDLKNREGRKENWGEWRAGDENSRAAFTPQTQVVAQYDDADTSEVVNG